MTESKYKAGKYPLLSLLAGIVILACMNMSSALADGALAEINIRLTGNVVALGCTVDPGDIDKTVKLGEWATKQLKRAGNMTTPVPFSIHLTGCTASGVTLAFSGVKDKQDSSLLALNGDSDSEDAAQGVAVQIMDSQRTRIPLGENAPRGIVDESGNLTLNFFANYVATADDAVTAGVADADSVFTLTYD